MERYGYLLHAERGICDKYAVIMLPFRPRVLYARKSLCIRIYIKARFVHSTYHLAPQRQREGWGRVRWSSVVNGARHSLVFQYEAIKSGDSISVLLI